MGSFGFAQPLPAPFRYRRTDPDTGQVIDPPGDPTTQLQQMGSLPAPQPPRLRIAGVNAVDEPAQPASASPAGLLPQPPPPAPPGHRPYGAPAWHPPYAPMPPSLSGAPAGVPSTERDQPMTPPIGSLPGGALGDVPPPQPVDVASIPPPAPPAQRPQLPGDANHDLYVSPHEQAVYETGPLQTPHGWHRLTAGLEGLGRGLMAGGLPGALGGAIAGATGGLARSDYEQRVGRAEGIDAREEAYRQAQADRDLDDQKARLGLEQQRVGLDQAHSSIDLDRAQIALAQANARKADQWQPTDAWSGNRKFALAHGGTATAEDATAGLVDPSEVGAPLPPKRRDEVAHDWYDESRGVVVTKGADGQITTSTPPGVSPKPAPRTPFDRAAWNQARKDHVDEGLATRQDERDRLAHDMLYKDLHALSGKLPVSDDTVKQILGDGNLDPEEIDALTGYLTEQLERARAVTNDDILQADGDAQAELRALKASAPKYDAFLKRLDRMQADSVKRADAEFTRRLGLEYDRDNPLPVAAPAPSQPGAPPPPASQRRGGGAPQATGGATPRTNAILADIDAQERAESISHEQAREMRRKISERWRTQGGGGRARPELDPTGATGYDPFAR